MNQDKQPEALRLAVRATPPAPAPVAVPEGWALVPLEATQEMIEAWGNATELPEGMAERSDDEVNAYAAQRDWKAMLAVAPAVVAVPDERSAFEAWAESVGLDHLARGFGKQDDYAFVETRRMWEAWQGRAALAATPPEPAAQAVVPYAVLVREIGESSFFDSKPIKPGSVQHQHAKSSPHHDYVELYAHPPHRTCRTRR